MQIFTINLNKGLNDVHNDDKADDAGAHDDDDDVMKGKVIAVSVVWLEYFRSHYCYCCSCARVECVLIIATADHITREVLLSLLDFVIVCERLMVNGAL